MRSHSLAVVAIALPLAVACVSHNVPDIDRPSRVAPSRMVVFVDQDGTFYPDRWKELCGEPSGREEFSLAVRARERGTTEQLAREQERVLREVDEYLASRDRVFVLVHGNNNTHTDAARSYELIEDTIELRPRDGIVEFHWDGLVGDGIGQGAIWFRAVHTSQIAGQFGLRRVLARMSDKEVVVIAHSRGASVVLSALSDPPHDPEFVEEVRERHGIDVTTRPPLPSRNNRISLLLLAPAVGPVDFGAPDWYAHPDDGRRPYRDLGDQVKVIAHTLNPSDPVLTKVIWFWRVSDPTGLGFDPKIAKDIAAHYGCVRSYDLEGMDAHGFPEYVRSATFRRMLRDLGVETAP